MKSFLYFLVALTVFSFSTGQTVEETTPENNETTNETEGEIGEVAPSTDENPNVLEPPFDINENIDSGPWTCEQTGNILLLEWLPFPRDNYEYAIINGSDRYVIERGTAKLDIFTKEAYPDVSLAFGVVDGDADYIYFDSNNIPVIGVEAFRNDHYFKEYLDIIYTIHGFKNQVDLWSHLLRYQDAFWPVRDRISSTFQKYIEDYSPQTNEPISSNEGPDDFSDNVQNPENLDILS